MPILFYLENTRVKIFYDIGGIMNLHFKNICRSKVFIISLISIIFIEFISTKSTREVESTTNLNFYFSGISVFYAYGIVISCFIALKYNLLKIFENKSILIKSKSVCNWFKYIDINSNILIMITIASFCLPPTIIGIVYRGIYIKEILVISFSIIVQIMGLMIIDQIFNFIYINKLNKTYSALLTLALVILPEYISKYLIKFNTITDLVFIDPNNIYNLKYITYVSILNIIFISIIKVINKKLIDSINKKDIKF